MQRTATARRLMQLVSTAAGWTSQAQVGQQGRRLAQATSVLETGVDNLSQATPAEAKAYNTLICVSILCGGLGLLHFALLRLWRHWGRLRAKKLPSLLVFPR